VVSIVATVVVAHLLALVSPGPDFLMVVRSSLRSRKADALGVAAGISLANGVYITLCIVGVGSLLAASLVLMTILKVAGGLFLLYVAFHALKSRKKDYQNLVAEGGTEPRRRNSFFNEFLAGFVSGISNPKNVIFYLSLFSVVLTSDVGLVFKIGLGTWMTLAVFLWDAFVILILTRPRVRRVFSRVAFYLDKVAGTLLGFIGIKLIESAFVKEGKA
jgi:threonine/homoserine/homoserine lactone efflux protein